MEPKEANAPFFVDREVIRLTRNGVWLSDETEISHEPTRLLFSRSLVRSPEGWMLRIGRETKLIEVEDTAYFVTSFEGEPSARITLAIAGGMREPLRPETLRYRPGRLTCQLENGEEAKFLHAPYFHLLQHLEEDAGEYFIRVSGTRVALAPKA